MSSSLKTRISNKLSELRKQGYLWVFRKFFRDHIYCHQRHVFLERDFSKPHRMYNRRQNWTFRIIQPSDIDEFRANFASRMKAIERQAAAGIIFVAVFYEDVLVGFMCYATRDYYEERYNWTVRLKEGEVYQFAGYLLPKYRGTPMVLEGMKYGQQYFKEQGYTKTTCIVDTDIISLVRLHLKLGFDESGAILHVWKFLNFRWPKLETYRGTRFEGYVGKRAAS